MLRCLFVFSCMSLLWVHALLLNSTIDFYAGGWVMDERACMILLRYTFRPLLYSSERGAWIVGVNERPSQNETTLSK